MHPTHRRNNGHVVLLSRRNAHTPAYGHHPVSVRPIGVYDGGTGRIFEDPLQVQVESKTGRFLARLLVWLLIFQPVYVAMGMELEPTDAVGQSAPNVQTETVSTTDEVTESDLETSDMDAGADVSDALVDDSEGEMDGDVIDVDDDLSTVPENSGEADVDNEVEGDDTDETTDAEGAHNDTDSDDGTVGNDGSEGSDTDTDDVGDATGGGDSATEDNDTATTTDETGEQSTTTEEILEEVTEATSTPETPVVAVHETEGSYTFNDGDCTLVAEGEFYCVAKDVQRYTEGDPQVYSEQDVEGDREIFYFDGNETHRITNNSYDDFAPVFEEETLRIVWQAMLNDRLQVMLHELPSNTTRQVTTARENSSNPHIAGDTLVWQGWVGTNWEVMMTDVDNNGGPFEIEQLTDNAVHDMFPRAYDDVITWQREKGASWEVIVFDPRTGKETALQKDESTKYENPRFVLLFDSKQANGDVETIGYDLDTGEMMELGTKAKQIPDEPKTPNDETEDAIPREATSTIQIKPVKEDDEGGEPLV